MTPDEDMRDHLATVLGLTAGSDVFASGVLAVDDFVKARAVFCLSSGGPPPEPILGGTTQIRRSTIQIRVRGEQDGYDDGLAFARSVRDAAQFAAISGFNMIRVQDSEPRYLGEDGERHPEWSIDVTMVRVA